jgi:DNA/RNA-binding domain of Phe-tRNA-synthetase-like protein
MSELVASLPVEPLPGLGVRALTALLPQPLGSLPPQEWLTALLQAGTAAPMTSSDALRKAVRDVLRQRGYRPTGRGKPSSEYLLNAAAEGRLAPINPVVDAGNAVSLHSGLPISIVDLDRVAAPLSVRVAAEGENYVFNASGQTIEIAGLPCLCDAAGACANAVKDAQRSKTSSDTRRVFAVVWGCTQPDPDLPARTATWLAEVLQRLGAETAVVPLA